MSSDAARVHLAGQCCAEGKVRPGLSRVGEIWTRGHRALCNTMGHYCTVITVMYSTGPGMGPRKGLTEFITSMRNILQALRGIYSHDPTLKDPERDSWHSPACPISPVSVSIAVLLTDG